MGSYDDIHLTLCIVLRGLRHNPFQEDIEECSLKGNCFKIRCLDSNKNEVSINGSLSVPCPFGHITDLSVLSLDLKGIIVCPLDFDLICFQKKKPTYLQTNGKGTNVVTTENITLFPRVSDVFKINERPRHNLTSKGTSLIVYETVIVKVFYTSIFCLIVLHVKIIDRLIFCMF